MALRSLQNYSMEHMVMTLDGMPVPPKVGMGATKVGWTDRHAYTVRRISKSGKTLWATRDKATRTDQNGMSEDQDYTFQVDEDAKEWRFSMRKDGRWMEAGARNSGVLVLGMRQEYYDYSF